MATQSVLCKGGDAMRVDVNKMPTTAWANLGQVINTMLSYATAKHVNVAINGTDCIVVDDQTAVYSIPVNVTDEDVDKITLSVNKANSELQNRIRKAINKF
mgnify:CR=1 FL=1